MSLSEAIDCIKQGKVLLTNTDTIAGLSCDARNIDAVNKIIDIKKRDKNKLNFVILVSSDRVLNQCIEEVSEIGWDLIDCADSPLTLIFEGAKNVAPQCMGVDKTLAIRYIKDGELKQLLDKVQCPLVSTSANISGKASPTNINSVDKEIKDKVDLIWESDTKGTGTASTIMKLKANGEFTFIRK
jgi:L-threonylcarbamoyladenylate synthase